VLGHEDALGLLDYRRSVQLGQTERRRSSLHRVHYGTPQRQPVTMLGEPTPEEPSQPSWLNNR
jgi:hypothetical protein